MKIYSVRGFEKLKVLKNKRIMYIVGILLLLAIAAAVSWLNGKNNEEPEITYEEVQVKKGDIVVGFEADGQIEFSKVNLWFGVKGTVAEILVAEGDAVKKGDIIARLDDADYQDEYQLALAKLKAAEEDQYIALLNQELQIKQAEVELESIRDEYQEMLLIPEAYSEHDLKMKKLELDNQEIQYRNLVEKYNLQVENNKSDELDQNELSVKIAQENLKDTVLYAPVSGSILDLTKKVGESITDEEDFAIIHEDGQIKAITNVIEYDIGSIETGQKVYIEVEALPDQKFTGLVTKIDSLPITDSSGLVNYQVEIDLLDPNEKIKDGMTCMVTVVRKEVKDCLIVPYKAVRIVEGKQVVTVINENGQKEERTIKAGFTDGTSVEVLAGLSVNETVVYEKKQVSR